MTPLLWAPALSFCSASDHVVWPGSCFMSVTPAGAGMDPRWANISSSTCSEERWGPPLSCSSCPVWTGKTHLLAFCVFQSFFSVNGFNVVLHVLYFNVLKTDPKIWCWVTSFSVKSVFPVHSIKKCCVRLLFTGGGTSEQRKWRFHGVGKAESFFMWWNVS